MDSNFRAVQDELLIISASITRVQVNYSAALASSEANTRELRSHIHELEEESKRTSKQLRQLQLENDELHNILAERNSNAASIISSRDNAWRRVEHLEHVVKDLLEERRHAPAPRHSGGNLEAPDITRTVDIANGDYQEDPDQHIRVSRSLPGAYDPKSDHSDSEDFPSSESGETQYTEVISSFLYEEGGTLVEQDITPSSSTTESSIASGTQLSDHSNWESQIKHPNGKSIARSSGSTTPTQEKIEHVPPSNGSTDKYQGTDRTGSATDDKARQSSSTENITRKKKPRHSLRSVIESALSQGPSQSNTGEERAVASESVAQTTSQPPVRKSAPTIQQVPSQSTNYGRPPQSPKNAEENRPYIEFGKPPACAALWAGPLSLASLQRLLELDEDAFMNLESLDWMEGTDMRIKIIENAIFVVDPILLESIVPDRTFLINWNRKESNKNVERLLDENKGATESLHVFFRPMDKNEWWYFGAHKLAVRHVESFWHVHSNTEIHEKLCVILKYKWKSLLGVGDIGHMIQKGMLEQCCIELMGEGQQDKSVTFAEEVLKTAINWKGVLSQE